MNLSGLSRQVAVSGPDYACQEEDIVLQGRYSLMYAPPYYYQVALRAIWEFYADESKTPFNTVYTAAGGTSSNFPSYTFCRVANLPLGQIKVKVRVLVRDIFYGTYIDREFVGYKMVYIGLPPFSKGISAPSNICPNGSFTASVAGIDGASSYSWIVPVGWTVNGLLGPEVENQDNTVQIMPCDVNNLSDSCSVNLFSSYKYSVRAVSDNCGHSPTISKNITIDFPYSINHVDVNDSEVRFSVFPSTYQQYNWTLPSGWVMKYNYGNSIVVDHNGFPGNVLIELKTTCGNAVYTRYSYSPPENSNCSVLVYPNPASKEIIIDPCITEISSVAIDQSFVKFESVKQNSKERIIDVSRLSPGVHVLRVRDLNGKDHFVKFIKQN